MGLLRDLGHPVEVWGWDEAYLGADVDEPDGLAEQIRELNRGIAAEVASPPLDELARQFSGFGGLAQWLNKARNLAGALQNEITGQQHRPPLELRLTDKDATASQ